jgi:hypothetical protein
MTHSRCATPTVLAITLAALSAGCARDDSPAVPFGPGLVPAELPAGPLAVGATARIRLGWAANSPPPAIRVQWRASDSSIAVVDSASRDGLTAYVRGVSAGRAAIVYAATIGANPPVGAEGTVPIVVQ